jgi:hypothetical protein
LLARAGAVVIAPFCYATKIAHKESQKIEFFKVHMVRQIVDQNAIGIVGCMRPLLEHRAIADSKLRLNECW